MSGLVETDFASIGMGKQMHIGMILVDLQKAFDTLDRGVLLEKLKYFGFRTSVTKWFESYPSESFWFVLIFFLWLEHKSTVYQKALFLDHSFFYYM